jgi:hypothetical protein
MFDFAQTAKTAALLFNSDAVVEVDDPAAIRARIDASHAPAFREAMVGGARQTETMTTRARARPAFNARRFALAGFSLGRAVETHNAGTGAGRLRSRKQKDADQQTCCKCPEA